MRYIAIALLALPFNALAEDKFLYYHFNEKTVIIISNVPCVLDQYKSQYPYTAVASRIDGARLVGCFKRENENNIKIQWQPINGKASDFTVFPANLFLPHIQPQSEAPAEITL